MWAWQLSRPRHSGMALTSRWACRSYVHHLITVLHWILPEPVWLIHHQWKKRSSWRFVWRMIRFTHVYKDYPRSGSALTDVNFHIRKGEFCFLTGHSGSGKSTMLKLIHMAEKPTRGEVRVSGFSSTRIK